VDVTSFYVPASSSALWNTDWVKSSVLLLYTYYTDVNSA
jgi:hypothetical protein